MSDVFAALGDSTRRALLDRLRRDGPSSLTELAEPLAMTRQAVTKHLNALEDAGLIERRHQGRERIHSLRPDPLRELSDWLAPYERAWDERLERLREHLDGDEE